MKKNIYPSVKSEMVKVATAFADIRGFSLWFQRVHNQGDAYSSLMNFFDEMVCDLKLNSGFFTKRMGDGFMVVARLSELHGSIQMMEFMTILHKIKVRMEKAIQALPSPRPEGFTVVVTAGYAEEKYHGNGDIDYRGYCLNLASKLKGIYRKKNFFIVHQSGKDILSQSQVKGFHLSFTKLPPPRIAPSGVFDIDLNELWNLQMRSNDIVK